MPLEAKSMREMAERLGERLLEGRESLVGQVRAASALSSGAKSQISFKMETPDWADIDFPKTIKGVSR